MSTKKLIAIVAAVVVTLGLLVTIFVGAIVGFAFYSIGNSEAAAVSKDFLQKNEQLKQDIGEVKEFGRFVTGSINVANSDGQATLNLKVIAERRTVTATVELTYHGGRAWRVTAASYTNEAGQTVDLLRPYEAQRLISRQVA
jgi:cytochrome oxidase complex assembly protein 1